MSIEFNTDQPQFKMRTDLNQRSGSGITGWLIKRGIVKDEASAKNVLLILIVLNFILTAFVIYKYVL